VERARHRQRGRDCQEHRPSPVPTRSALNVLGAVIANAGPAIAIRSYSPSCVTSRPTCQPSSTSISSSTTALPTSIPMSELGSHAVRVGTFISHPPMPPSSTRSNASSPSSLNVPSAALRLYLGWQSGSQPQSTRVNIWEASSRASYVFVFEYAGESFRSWSN